MTPIKEERYERKKVYDPLLRLLHWTLALSIVVLLASAWSEELFEEGPYEKAIWLLHIYAGYVLIGALVARVIWGLIGPRHARLSDLWHPAEWIRFIRRPSFRMQERFGHDVMASAAYLFLYVALLAMAVTGLGLAAVEHSTGPLASWFADSVWLEELFEEPHEAIAVLIAGFIFVHLAAMVLHERLEKTPVAGAMLSGYQYRIRKDSNQETTTEHQKENSE